MRPVSTRRSITREFRPSHGLVYRRSDGAVRVVSRKAAVLEGLQERRRRDGDRSVLRDAVQRSVDHELLQRQVERITRLSPSHPAHPHLQAHQALSGTPGQCAILTIHSFSIL